MEHRHHGKSSANFLDSDEILTELNLNGNETFLDAGCGDGYISKKAIEDYLPEGKVYAEVWYIVKEEKSAYYNNMTEEKRGAKRLVLKVNNHNIRLLSIPKKVNVNERVVLFKNDLFKVYIEDMKKYKLDKQIYKREQLQKVLETKAKKEINKRLEKGEYIISQKTLKTEYKNGKMYIEVFFKVYEDIAEEKDIAQIEKKEDE